MLVKYPKILALFILVLVTTGAGCAWFGTDKGQETAPKKERKLGVHDASVKREYEQNVGIWIEEMTIQIGKLKAYRPNIPAAKRQAFDGRVQALELQFEEFKKDLEDFKVLPATDFLPGRAVVNQSLDVVWQVYSKIVVDFEVKYEDQP